MDLGPAELGIILVIVLVLFGGKKLPELARSLGKAKAEFESGQEAAVETCGPSPAPPALPGVPSPSADAGASGTPADGSMTPGRDGGGRESNPPVRDRLTHPL